MLNNQKGAIYLFPLLVIIALLGVVTFLLITSIGPFKGQFSHLFNKPTSKAANLNWYQGTQIYGMVPILPNDAQNIGLTLNGLWGGYGTESSFRPASLSAEIRATYRTDRDYVDATHQQGIKVAATISSSFSYPDILKNYPLLNSAIDIK